MAEPFTSISIRSRLTSAAADSRKKTMPSTWSK